MAVKFTDPLAEYPYIFMIEQSIHQRTFANQSANPEYSLSLVWIYYKFDEQGNVTVDPDSQYSYYDDDFYVSAAMDYQIGETAHFSTLSAQEISIARIVAQETGKGTEVV